MNPLGLGSSQIPHLELIKHMSEDDIVNFCQVNRDINSICNKESTWLTLLKEEGIDARMMYLIWRRYKKTNIPIGSSITWEDCERILPIEPDQIWCNITLWNDGEGFDTENRELLKLRSSRLLYDLNKFFLEKFHPRPSSRIITFTGMRGEIFPYEDEEIAVINSDPLEFVRNDESMGRGKIYLTFHSKNIKMMADTFKQFGKIDWE